MEPPEQTPKKRFACPKCSRLFSRQEHVARHFASHSNETSFVCPKCSRSFGRRDALKRHQSVHQPRRTPLPRELDDVAADARRRAALSRTKRACLRCARAKLKCDGNEPCSRCRERDGEAVACRYSSEPNVETGDESQHKGADSLDHPWGGVTPSQSIDVGEHRADGSLLEPTSDAFDWPAEMTDRDDGEMSIDPVLMGLATPSGTTSSSYFDEGSEQQPQQQQQQQQQRQQQQQQMALVTDCNTDNLVTEYGSVFDWISGGAGSSPYDALPWSAWLDAAAVAASPYPPSATGAKVTFADVAPEQHRNSLDVLSSAALREEQGRIETRTMEPVDVRQPSRRNSMSSQRWPNSWHPEAADMGLPAQSVVENVGEEVDLLENTYQVDGFDDEARNRLLQMCYLTDMSSQEMRRAHKILSSVTNETFNVMVQLFFEKFENAFVHRATFKASQCNVLLLGAICSIGTMYSSLAKAHILGSILVDLVHRAIMATTSKDNLHARSLSSIQALVLVCIYLARSSNRRHLEHAEACRSAVITMVRRCRLLDDVASPVTPEAAEPAHWHDWLSWETGRRVGWAVFVADMALCTSWKLAPCFSLDELKAQLPGDEASWDAPDSEAWARSYRQACEAPLLSRYHEALQQSSIGQRIREEANVFQSSVVAYSLSLMSMSLTAMQESCLSAQAMPLCAHFRARLREAVDGTPAPTSPTFEFITRFTLLRMAVSFHDLQAMGSRKGRAEAKRAMDRVHSGFDSNPQAALELAVDAGRILYLFKSGAIVATCDVNAFYYAAVSLLAFSTHWRRIAPPPSSREPRIVRLDGRELVRPGPSARLVLAGVGELHEPAAPTKIVQSAARFLFSVPSNAPSYHAAQTLGSVLSGISA